MADDADPASTATASDAAIQESYVEEDQASEAAHVDVTAIRGASQDPENIHVTITRDDGTVVRDAVLGVSGVNAGTLADVSLPVTDTARDFAIVAWDAWDQTGQAGRKEIDVHVASLDVGTMGVVNGHNGSTSWLANDEKNSDGAWLPLNTENNAYQFTGTTPNQDRNENGDGKSTEQGIVSFTDDALLPIQITPSDDATSYSLTFNQNILHIFQYVNHTGMVHSGDVLTVNAPTQYYVEGFAGRAGTSANITLNAIVNGQARYVDQVKINIFTWQGPQDVPNYATYAYTASGGASGSTWVGPYEGALATGSTATTANILWNSNAAVVGLAEFQAAPQYTWGYDVNVVAVTPQAGSLQINTRRSGGQYMYANLPVTISGPSGTEDVRIGGTAQAVVERGVRFIQVGFLQTLQFVSQDATYMDKSGRNTIKCSEYYGATTMDNTTVLDTMTAPRSRPLPWYCAPYSSKMPDSATPLTAFWNGGAHANGGSDTSVNIATTDSPFMNTIFPPVLANHRRYYCAQIIFSWQLTTYLAVRTTESVKKATGSANPPNVYTPRASADWTFTRNGRPGTPAALPKLAVTGGGMSTAFASITNGTALPAKLTTAAGAVANDRLNNGFWDASS